MILPLLLFVVLILVLFALDLGVFHREPRPVGAREALAWTGVWVVAALAFDVGIYWAYDHNWLGIGMHTGAVADGRTAAVQFLTGYVVEKSLSLDNIFVIALIFAYFRVPATYQHRVLFWGVLGALVLRGVMIAAGAILIARFAWTTYVFGGVLLVTAASMLVDRHDNLEAERNIFVRLLRRRLGVTADFDGDRFFTQPNSRRVATPLLVTLVLVETSDVVFAVDSIPAVFAITRDPFLVFTSNVFAILGLRSLYFALAAFLDRFRYLKTSLVFVLAYVGVKMILSRHHHVPAAVSLAVIVGILGVGVLASLLPRRDTAPLGRPPLSGGPPPEDATPADPKPVDPTLENFMPKGAANSDHGAV